MAIAKPGRTANSKSGSGVVGSINGESDIKSVVDLSSYDALADSGAVFC